MPPHLRNTGDDKRKAELEKLKRNVKGLLNRYQSDYIHPPTHFLILFFNTVAGVSHAHRAKTGITLFITTRDKSPVHLKGCFGQSDEPVPIPGPIVISTDSPYGWIDSSTENSFTNQTCTTWKQHCHAHYTLYCFSLYWSWYIRQMKADITLLLLLYVLLYHTLSYIYIYSIIITTVIILLCCVT